MSTQNVTEYPGWPRPLPTRLGKTALFFLAIAIVTFLFVKIVGPLLQTTPELVVEAIISGVPLLIAIGCAIAALVVKISRSVRHVTA